MSKTPLYFGKFTYNTNQGVIDALNKNKLVYFYTVKETNPHSNRKREIVYIGKSSIGKRDKTHVEFFHWLTSFLTAKHYTEKLKGTGSFSFYIIEVCNNVDPENIEHAFIKAFMKEYKRKPVLNKNVSKKEIETLLQNSGITKQDLKVILGKIEADNTD
jgi:hypothetical protein